MEEHKNYIQNLLKKVQLLYDQKQETNFTIVEGKNKGFLVKVTGLFAYVPYHLMPWHYPSLSCWKCLNENLKGKVFKGVVSQLDKDPIKIVINAQGQTFNPPELYPRHKYKGVVIQKTNYGLFVELGMHFDWKYGSLIGLLHKSVFREPASFMNAMEGQELVVTFQGYTQEGKMALGEIWEEAKWTTREIEEFIGTQQEVTVMSINSKKTFYVNGIHKAIAPINRLSYPNCKDQARYFKNNLKDGQTIFCEVIKISKKKDCFIIRLPIPD